MLEPPRWLQSLAPGQVLASVWRRPLTSFPCQLEHCWAEYLKDQQPQLMLKPKEVIAPLSHPAPVLFVDNWLQILNEL